jgi:regulatory protein
VFFHISIIQYLKLALFLPSFHTILKKGIKKELINLTLEDTECDERRQIKALIDKKYYRYLSDASDKKAIQKVYAALARKGFSFGAIKDALKEYTTSLEYIDEE